MLNRFSAIPVVLALAAMLLPGGPLPPDRAEAKGPAAVSKISGLLAHQVQGKLRLRAAAADLSAPASASLQGVESSDPFQAQAIDSDRQRVFIHATEAPTQPQIAELQADNITVIPDSWIPPVGNHPTGFFQADMPADKLETLAAKNYVTRLETAEVLFEPQNDLAAQQMSVPAVWASGYDGAGVRIAVLDSGLDLTHPDIPTPVASKDYGFYPVLNDTIANTVSGHGTHVTGSALGRGTQSGGAYKGMAPGADLIFLKIGRDTTSSATTSAIVNAIRDAVDIYDADVITMSYGGWSTYHDGSGETAQAVDYAVSRGAVVLTSAGNSANDREHFSGTVGANGSTGSIRVNVSGAGTNNTNLNFNLVWSDGPGPSNDLVLEYYNASLSLLPSASYSQTDSPRGTKSQFSSYVPYLPSGSSTWYLRVKNNSSSSQFFHIYVDDFGGGSTTSVTFQDADPGYTLSSPADADSAIAVGSFVSRASWTSYKGGSSSYSQTIDAVASYSSRGPRVDTGAPIKPNITAPGSSIISTRDSIVYPPNVSPVPSYDSRIIDNDGLALNGSGPADYLVMQGTSMASPLAAGVAALILQKNPTWTPAQVKSVIESTATDYGDAGPDGAYGWGLIDARAAIATTPTIITLGPSNIATNSATLSGNLTAMGTAASVDVSFEWGATPGGPYGNTTGAQSRTTSGAFSAAITSLTPNTTYFYRARATGDGTGYGAERSVTTLSPLPPPPPPGSGPTVATVNATDVGFTSARLNGNLTSLGSASSANVSFQLGVTSGNFTGETVPQSMNATGNFSFTLGSLSAGTTYYYRAKASGSGTAYGAESSFTTPPGAGPTVATGNATRITVNSARLNGTLDSLGTASSANVSFQWGPSPLTYTGQTTVQLLNAPGSFYFDLEGLSSNTTYYFRALGLAHGTSAGSEKSFYVPSPLSISTDNATGITLNSARLNGALTSPGAGSSTNVSFLWGTMSGNLTANTPIQSMTGAGDFHFDLGSLSSNTTYYFKAKAVGDNVSYGTEKSFSTLTPPSVATNGATQVNVYSATLNGTLTSSGTAQSANVSFQYGTNSGNLAIETAMTPMDMPGAFSVDLAGLSANTTYYYRAKATGHGTSYGAAANFTTLAPLPPEVTTEDATDVSFFSATLSGNLTSLGTAESANVSFRWGPGPGNYTAQSANVPMSRTGAFSANLTGLSANTTYYYRAGAEGHGSDSGIENSFATPATSPPVVTTDNATGITYSSARLNGNLVSSGTGATSVAFQWGTAPGNLTGETTSQARDVNGTFVIDLTNLSASTTYYFRAKAAGHGASYGGTNNFTTLAAPPPPPPPSGGGGGGGGGGGAATVSLNGLSGSLPIGGLGHAMAGATLGSPDGNLSLNIAFSTQMLGPDSRPIASLTAAPADSPPTPPPGNSVVMAYDLGPDGATFSPPIVLALKYDPTGLPIGADESTLVIAVWDGSVWTPMETTVDAEANTASARVSHFSKYAMLAPSPATAAPPEQDSPAPPVTAATRPPEAETAPALPPEPAGEPAVDPPLPTQQPTQEPAPEPVPVTASDAAVPAAPTPDAATSYRWTVIIAILASGTGSAIFFRRRSNKTTIARR